MSGEKAPFAKSADYGKNDKSSMNAGGSWARNPKTKPFKGAKVSQSEAQKGSYGYKGS